MTSIHEVIEALRQAPTNSERGSEFERLMVRYFQLDPTLASKYDRVWRWVDWPDHQGMDTGIDLVARERDRGELTAIQCKFYEPTHTLAKKDLDSFFTASGRKPFTGRIIISTTDNWGSNAEAALVDQHIPVTRIDMAHLAASPIRWDVAWPAQKLEIILELERKNATRPHQRLAIDKVSNGFAGV